MQQKKKQLEDEHHGKFKFTLEMPSYLPFMQYCQNESLRKEFYQAYVTRATKGDRDNSPIIEEILFLRTKKAKLLGYKNYSEYSLASKMANNPKEVFSFLNELKKKSQIKIKRDITEIENYCQKNNITRGTAAWNRAWVTQKMELEMYQVDQEKIKEYFPEHKVLQGLFEIIHRLYQVKIAEKKQDSWHKDVRFFNLIQANKIIGSIFLDLYARPQKRSGAWMNDLLSRRQLKEGKQLPVAYVVCNFSSPTADKPALFTHDEVQTLFHEFGHALHHLLTQIDNPYFSGINGVPWDGVELPSQLFENWCWDRESLSMISAHYQTQEPLSKEIVDKIKKAKNFLSGIAMARQLEFSLLDMELHTRYQPKKKSNPPAFRALIVKIQNEISPFEIPNFSRFENAFLHIFAGGYAAGYYSYKWAEVLSADCFSRFNKEGLLNLKTAQDFYREILSIGGSKPFKEAFIAFMGRDPKIESLLINNGIMTA